MKRAKGESSEWRVRQLPLHPYTPTAQLSIIGSALIGHGRWRDYLELGGMPIACDVAYDRVIELLKAEAALLKLRERARARAFAWRARKKAEEKA